MLRVPSLYKSFHGFRTIIGTYNQQLRRWPVAYRELMLKTRFGRTHVIASGPEDAPPLVLVHGLGVNALVWRPNVAALSKYFRVYALDNIGDMGKSAPTRPPLHNDAYARWLVDVLDGLGYERANIMGVSLGGWITLKTAIHAPDRVDKIIPLCPAGFVPIRLGFALTAVRASVFPSEQTIGELQQSLVAPNATMCPEDREMIDLCMRYHRVKLVPLIPLRADELARVKAPTMLLIGAHDAIFDAEAMVERAQRLIADVRTEIIPAAGHGVHADAPERLHQLTFEFLGMAS